MANSLQKFSDRSNHEVATAIQKQVINKSENTFTLTFAHDYLGRRIRKTVANGPSGSTDTKFLWFGWNLAAELEADGVTPTKAFVWGPDLESLFRVSARPGSTQGPVEIDQI